MNIASYIDHTALKPDTTIDDIKILCKEALEYGFASVCVNPVYVSMCKELLNDSDVKVCTVVGFPLGANTTETKAFEADNAIKNGADEVDMVINVSALKDGLEQFVYDEIAQVADVCKNKAVLKVIIETCLLNDDEKKLACEIAKRAGADFVKTSTGFSHAGADVNDIIIMRKTVGDSMGIKASGGIRDYNKAMQMIEAGATRIGASASVDIVKTSL